MGIPLDDELPVPLNVLEKECVPLEEWEAVGVTVGEPLISGVSEPLADLVAPPIGDCVEAARKEGVKTSERVGGAILGVPEAQTVAVGGRGDGEPPDDKEVVEV